MSNNNDQNIFGETDWINEEYTEVFLPPTIQWRRGDLTNQNPFLKNGCWQLQTESFEVFFGNSIPVVDVLHSGGVVVPSYLFGTLHLSVLAWKKRWYMLDSGSGQTQLKYLTGYEDGAKSKLQYWALIRELGNEPALVSVSGMNAKYLSEASQAFRQKVLRPAVAIAKKNFGQHHFWMPLASQGKIATKQNQYITPPGLALKEINNDVLKELYLGKEIGQKAEEMIKEARAWANTKEQPRGQELEAEGMAGNGQGRNTPPPPPNWYDDEAPEPISEDEIPF